MGTIFFIESVLLLFLVHSAYNRAFKIYKSYCTFPANDDFSNSIIRLRRILLTSQPHKTWFNDLDQWSPWLMEMTTEAEDILIAAGVAMGRSKEQMKPLIEKYEFVLIL